MQACHAVSLLVGLGVCPRVVREVHGMNAVIDILNN